MGIKDSSNDKVSVDKLSLKSSSKRCLHKEIARLIEENQLLAAKLEGTEINLGKFYKILLYKTMNIIIKIF